MTTRVLRSTLSSLAVASLFLSQSITFAATGDVLETGTGGTVDTGTGNGTITIDQILGEGEQNVYGEWTLIHPNNEHTTSDNEHFVLTKTRLGKYSFGVKPPEGASAVVTYSINGVAQPDPERPQISIVLQEGQDIVIKVTFNYNRIGSVTINSTPKGLTFLLKGPDDREFKGKTPESFENVPEGLYTVYFDPVEGCVTPKPKSDRLKKDGRVNLTIGFDCDKLNDLENVQEEEKALSYVNVILEDGTRILFEDAPLTAWYANYVFKAAKTGIIRGYRDDEGNYTGEFGPGNNVTLAELAKIAHEVAGIDETKMRVNVQNIRARDTWFAEYYASAEQRYWLAYQNALEDPVRPATRGEVVATLLQALDIPLNWPKGSMFGDVSPLTPYAAAIETAAEAGLIAGYTNSDGTETGLFGPTDPINRAELSKIITLVIEKYAPDTPEVVGGSR